MQLSCSALLPMLACAHRDQLVYLLPSLVLAVTIHLLTYCHPLFFVFTLPGTLCHELAHFCIGYLTGAQPTSLSLIPRRMGARWQLGAVQLSRLRWYNAAPAALAPFLILALPLAVAWWRTRYGLQFNVVDLALCFLLAPQFLSCWPSGTDWRLALRSWPYLPIAGVVYLAIHPQILHGSLL